MNVLPTQYLLCLQCGQLRRFAFTARIALTLTDETLSNCLLVR